MASYLSSQDSRGTPEKIVAAIERLDADVIVLPEAYNGVAISPAVKKRLHAFGYEWLEIAYEDPDREEEIALYGKSHIAIMSRLGFVSKKIVRFGGIRNLLVIKVREPRSGLVVQIIGAHLEDRSEAKRQQQLDEIIPFVNLSTDPTILMGDLNALWPGMRARIIGSLFTRMITRVLPAGDLKSELSRLIEMARGTTMQRLHDEAHLNKADPRYRATVTPKKRNLPYLPSIRLCQIDHILVPSCIKATNFMIAPDSGSDHRAISVNVSIF